VWYIPQPLQLSLKMGATLSQCVNLAGQAVYLEDTYTVVRTNGEKQDGWLLKDKRHRCYHTPPQHARPHAHALLREQGWKVHLHNGDHDDEDGSNYREDHACGWRKLGTFWPTRLTGDQPAIDAWTEALRDRLEELAAQQGLPQFYQEHSCGKGAPANMCDGCIAIERASEQKALLDERAALLAAAEPLAQAARLAQVDYRLAKLKIYSAAYNRAWKAWRAAQDELEAAEEDYLIACGSRSWENHDGLKAEVERLNARAAELRPAAFPVEPVDPDAEPERPPTPLPPPPSKLDERLAELGAVPYHPVYAPLPVVKPLPDPMDNAARRLALGDYKAPDAPDTSFHACAYFDGAPWDFCPACEYQRNPSLYRQKARHSELVQLISAYWRDARKGATARDWSNETLEAIVAFLDTPRTDRPFTDKQVADPAFSDWRNHTLLAGLRQLNA
jgi:hypothetical protein